MSGSTANAFVACSALAIRPRDIVCHGGANHFVEDVLQNPPGKQRHTVDITLRQLTEGDKCGNVVTINFGKGQQLRRCMPLADVESRARRSACLESKVARGEP